MISSICFFANLIVGYKLRLKVRASAASIHPAISITVKAVTTGSGTRIIRVMIIPNATPAAKLPSETTKLCVATIFKIVPGLAPKALKTPYSWRCSDTVNET